MVRYRPLPSRSPYEGFEAFYRASYRDLIATAMFYGATPEDAEDAASETLEKMLHIWPVTGYPLAYARKAVVHNFVKARTRGTRRTVNRLIERDITSHQLGELDEALTDQEEREWIYDLLSELPAKQREVMLRIVEGSSRKEIISELDISADVFRRRLCDARTSLVELLNLHEKPDQPSNGSREEER